MIRKLTEGSGPYSNSLLITSSRMVWAWLSKSCIIASSVCCCSLLYPFKVITISLNNLFSVCMSAAVLGFPICPRTVLNIARFLQEGFLQNARRLSKSSSFNTMDNLLHLLSIRWNFGKLLLSAESEESIAAVSKRRKKQTTIKRPLTPQNGAVVQPGLVFPWPRMKGKLKKTVGCLPQIRRIIYLNNYYLIIIIVIIIIFLLEFITF